MRVGSGLLLHEQVALAVASVAVVQSSTGVESPEGTAADLWQTGAVADFTLHPLVAVGVVVWVEVVAELAHSKSLHPVTA
jgi:hypothetical protein